MSNVSGTSALSTAAPQAGATSSANGASARPSAFASGDFETFLRMLTTQIKNQDPLNPMEGSDFAVQLATFSGVEQQVRTNQLLAGMGTNGGVAGLAQYADWIGKEGRSTTPVSFTNQPITLEIVPDATADKVVLVSRDSLGRVTSREDIGPGQGSVDWFGRDSAGAKLADGTYTFEIESWKGEEKLSTSKVESYAAISAVETGTAGVTLVLANGARVLASAVTALRTPRGV